MWNVRMEVFRGDIMFALIFGDDTLSFLQDYVQRNIG